MVRNKSLIYKKYTPYEPVVGEHLAVEDRPFDPEAAPPAGGLTIKNSHLSFDPYMRGQMRAPGDNGSYSVPWVIDQPAQVTTLSTVLKSDNPAFKPGDLVSAMASASEYSIVGPEFAHWCRAIPPLPPQFRPETLVGGLGIAGLSAYISFNEFVKEPKGKVMFVSAASGGVGQIVGQLGKIHGMKVIGSTGSQEKVDFVVNKLGYDGAWNYKEEKTDDALKRLAPEGLDVYYDNVGGEQLDTALMHMNDYGTIVSSGMVSQYNIPWGEMYGIRNLGQMFLKRLSMHGFICSDERHVKYLETFGKDVVTWMMEGKIKTKEEVLVGLDMAPQALLRVWKGDKFGKMVLKVDEN
ncbi:unnamed protein product [Clonostachys byssicola]|uniref:Dehydrogenase FUB6 n=1 Tax=Clonostachys byssicola TaxID=160290 RepID=A0A9N9UAU1_9HYPO|nr:unnamed protein product [Clonostachys byssicola]